MLKSFKLDFNITLNQKLPDIKAGFRKGRGTRDQVANICWIIGRAREFKKKSSASLCYGIGLCWSQQTLENS